MMRLCELCEDSTFAVAAHFVLMIGISAGVKPPDPCLICTEDSFDKFDVGLNNADRANIAIFIDAVVCIQNGKSVENVGSNDIYNAIVRKSYTQQCFLSLMVFSCKQFSSKTLFLLNTN